MVWRAADDERRREIEQLVDVSIAEVAFAAATGELERYRGEPDYRLWKVVSEGGSRSEEWWARVSAAPTFGRGLRIAARAPLVNVDHLAHRLGRTADEARYRAEFFAPPRTRGRRGGTALRRKAAGDDRYRRAGGVGLVEQEDVLYAAVLPDGPIVVLDGLPH